MPDTLKEELKAALQKDSSAPEPAAPEKDTTVKTESVSGDDTAAGKTTVETDAEKKPDPVPYDRFKEKVDEANTLKQEKEKLQSDLLELAKSIKAGEKITTTEKKDAKEDIETLVQNGQLSRQDADIFIRMLNAAGVKRGESEAEKKVSALEKELATMKALVYGDKDQQNLRTAVSKYEGIVTEDQVKEKLKEMAQSKDPDRKYAAEHFSYEKIIQMEFAKEIYAHEAEQVLKAKEKPAPKVPAKGTGGDSPKKPEKEEPLFDPGKPRTFAQSLKNEIKNKIRSAGE